MTKMSVVTADAPEALLARMEQDLAAAPLPPFDDECIVVQSLGMDRWVRQQFARRQGCAASLAMPFPAAFCRQLATTLQRDRRFATGDGVSIDPRFEEQALTWRVFTLLGDAEFLALPVNEPLRAFLTGATEAKRFGLAQRITARFDEYRLYRPDVLIAWEEQGASAKASEHEAWQAALWRSLLGDTRPAHFARWFTSTIAQLESIEDVPAGLPARVSVFGVSTLPPLFVRLLRAVARFVPVRFYVLMPQLDGWRPDTVRHPLFESFGASSRELVQQLLTAADLPGVEHVTMHAQRSQNATLLQHMQRAVATGESLPLTLSRDDRSFSVHVCHSPLRELEVLRDQLLDAFAADPTLRPHDVLVMAPDVEQYAPMAEAIFGRARTGVTSGMDEERPAIPYRIADRTLSRESAPATALAAMLQLVHSRLSATDVVELLSQPMVRRAAGIAAAQMDQVTQWIEDAAIRWGQDASTRAAWHGTPLFAENSWRTGLDRLLAGYATGRVDALVQDVLPIAGDLAGDTELLGRFVQWVESLFERLQQLQHERSLGHWTAALQDVLDWLVAAEDADERTDIDRVRRELERLASTTDSVVRTEQVAFEVVREWVVTALADDDQASGFLTGGLTLCAMKPMRAIPHRIIVMLGLDDRAYPRRLRRAAFDMIGAHPRDGDRDPRADDRQFVLDTLLSAGDRLMLSYVGRSQANNAEMAPSVVVTELLDAIDRLYPSVPPPSAQVRVEHRLQPFSPAYFDQAHPRLFSFDQRLARSVAASTTRVPAPPFFDGAVSHVELVRDLRPGYVVPHTDHLELTIDDLMEAWINPSRLYCRRVLQLSAANEALVLDDVEPMSVNVLQRVTAQQYMVERTLAGKTDVTRERMLAAASGSLPPAALGGYWHDQLRRGAAPVLNAISGVAFDAPLLVEVHGIDWTVRGQCDLQRGDEQWRVRAGRLTARDKARAWIAHVVRCAAAAPITTRVISLDLTITLAPAVQAASLLDLLVQMVRAIHVAPVPYFLEAASEYRSKLAKDREGAMKAAYDSYHKQPGDYGPGGDGCDAYVQLLWRGRDPIEELADQFRATADAFWTPFEELVSE